MSSFTPKVGGNNPPDADLSLPDFENNLVEFETAFKKLITDTDPTFNLSLLRYNPLPAIPEPAPLPAEVFYPTRKQDLNRAISVTGPKVIEGNVFGESVTLEGEVQVTGSVYGMKTVNLGPNCRVDGNVVSGGSLTVADGCRFGGSLTGEEVRLEGKITVKGPVVSRSNFTLQGTLEAQELVALRNIYLNGGGEDYLKLEASSLFAQNGEINTNIPVRLGQSGRVADPEAQRFYITRAVDGTFRLARAPSPYQEGVRPAQGTIITNLTDADLEKLLAELTSPER